MWSNSIVLLSFSIFLTLHQLFSFRTKKKKYFPLSYYLSIYLHVYLCFQRRNSGETASDITHWAAVDSRNLYHFIRVTDDAPDDGFCENETCSGININEVSLILSILCICYSVWWICMSELCRVTKQLTNYLTDCHADYFTKLSTS
jgi:hypothetical protein